MKLHHYFNQASVWRALGAGAVLHLILALSVGLSPDEAHYALYAWHLDWSYYDHPPLVGWLQWPFVQLGASDVLLRVAPMLAWVLTSLGLVVLSDALFPGLQRLQYWGVRIDLLLFVLSPLPNLLGFAWVPDTLLMLLIVWVMVLTWLLCQFENLNARTYWVLLGLALGLAGLSKYTAILLALSVALCLIQAYGLQWLRHSGPWLAVFVALLCVVPVVVWNAQHDWASFSYQLNHAKGSGTWSALKALAYLATLWLALGLILPIALAAGRAKPHTKALATAQATVHLNLLTPRISAQQLSLYFGLPGLLLFVFLAGKGSTLPHWSTPFGVALIPLAAWGLSQKWISQARRVRSVLMLQLVLLLAFLTIMGVGGVSPERGAQTTSLPGQKEVAAVKNPFADLFGWELAAQRAVQLADQHAATTLGVMNWTLASRIAWYARPWPVKVIYSHQDQFDRWFGSVEAQDRVLWVDWSVMSYAPPVGPHAFASCQYLEGLPVYVWGRQIAHFNYAICTGWKS